MSQECPQFTQGVPNPAQSVPKGGPGNRSPTHPVLPLAAVLGTESADWLGLEGAGLNTELGPNQYRLN